MANIQLKKTLARSKKSQKLPGESTLAYLTRQGLIYRGFRLCRFDTGTSRWGVKNPYHGGTDKWQSKGLCKAIIDTWYDRKDFIAPPPLDEDAQYGDFPVNNSNNTTTTL